MTGSMSHRRSRRRLRGRAGQGGFTLLEAAVSSAILALVMQTAVSATLVMTRSGEFGMSEIERGAKAQQSLQRVVNELRNSSRDTDVLGNPYMEVSGEEGSETMTFRRVAEFGENGAEIVPIWSSEIELFRDGNQLVRRQDGVTTPIVNNVESLDFTVDSLGRVDVQIGFFREAAGAAGVMQHSLHHLRVSPQR